MRFYTTGDDHATYRWDLGALTDGQPVYSGVLDNPPDSLTSSELEDIPLWQIHLHEYTVVGTDNVLTSRKVATGAWSSRASLSYR